MHFSLNVSCLELTLSVLPPSLPPRPGVAAPGVAAMSSSCGPNYCHLLTYFSLAFRIALVFGRFERVFTLNRPFNG